MTKYFLLLCMLVCSIGSSSQDLKDITIDSDVTKVQPMTGLVFWPTNSRRDTDAITLEFSYMKYSDVVVNQGEYNWEPVEDLLDEMAGRNHQAVLRFRFSYPGRTTTVPQYIKDLQDYNEEQGLSEGNNTYFPDWTHPELERFTLEFYEKFAEQYDEDPRLAYVQTGFGLWAEYHIYDGPRIIGTNFPSKDFQSEFIEKLEASFESTYWSISIDAADSYYSPFSSDEELKSVVFGLFDDSFMHSTHSGHNESNWDFFDRSRYEWAPAGGEFSYYTTYDQQNVLNPHVGAHGEAFELAVERFHMTYINANDQPSYQTMDRIHEASLYMGYKFKINSFKSGEGQSIVEVENVGVAPIYIDAYIAVDGLRATESLKLLAPGEILVSEVAAGGDTPVLTIESDMILETQQIDFYGTENEPYVYVPVEVPVTILKIDDNLGAALYDVFIDSGSLVVSVSEPTLKSVLVLDLVGNIIRTKDYVSGTDRSEIDVNGLSQGVYVVRTNIGTKKVWLSR